MWWWQKRQFPYQGTHGTGESCLELRSPLWEQRRNWAALTSQMFKAPGRRRWLSGEDLKNEEQVIVVPFSLSVKAKEWPTHPSHWGEKQLCGVGRDNERSCVLIGHCATPMAVYLSHYCIYLSFPLTLSFETLVPFLPHPTNVPPAPGPEAGPS